MVHLTARGTPDEHFADSVYETAVLSEKRR
jgi:hypothetical protein